MPRPHFVNIVVATADADAVEAALREAGFSVERTASVSGGDTSMDARKTPVSDDRGADVLHEAETALAGRGIAYRVATTGVIMGGGTPEHAWVQVVVDGQRTNLKILAASDAEADAQLDDIARELGVTRDRVNIAPPPGWAGYGAPTDED